ncbi:ImmA/IrrE family metallo-endopeptidase [uncultured Amphritea sp.]|uniref:ImmA/IrrE family metallo-endopeptidase n=1 Tax=uncultured Amphritea sp. TaxID=981605 RepID=UPI00261AD7B3|nr:ImmA/IrrE family metallo-endopeptidase [uncultured Amphritea sp.]
MITLDRMDLADCFTPEDIVNEIFRQCPTLMPPIPVCEIAKATGIKDIIERDLASIGGMLVADEEKNTGIILHHTSGPIGRKRFTIGHELGHFLLLHHGANQSCLASNIKEGSSASSNAKAETEANEFAQRLLMPDSFVASSINSSLPDIELLCDISITFGVSFEAMSNKCALSSNYPFALVYSHKGIVRYCWRNRNLFTPKIPLKRGDRLPDSSQAIRFSQNEDSISHIQSVDPSCWLEPGNDHISLEEQTFTQKDGYQVTLLRIKESTG